MSHHTVSIETAKYLASHTLHGRRKAVQSSLQVKQTEVLKAVQLKQNKSFLWKQEEEKKRQEKLLTLKQTRLARKARLRAMVAKII